MFRNNLALVALLGLTSIGWAGPESFFDERVHDFGATPRGPQLVHYFRFTNNSKETVTISNVRVSCGCTSASAAVTQVKAGESSYITASMDSRRFSGVKAVTVYVDFMTPRFEEVTLQVQANGRDDFTMTPDSIAIGTIRKGANAKGSIQVTLVGDRNWEIKEAKADSNYVQPAAKLVARTATEVTYEISASLRPDLPVGKWYTDLWLTTNNGALAKFRVPLTVDVEAVVTATPAAAMLGEIKLGDTSEQNIKLKSDKPFTIKTVLGTDEVVSVSGVGNEAKVIHVLKVQVKPKQIGDVSRKLSVVIDNGAETLTIPISATSVKEAETASSK
jgi:hypothetical protein